MSHYFRQRCCLLWRTGSSSDANANTAIASAKEIIRKKMCELAQLESICTCFACERCQRKCKRKRKQAKSELSTILEKKFNCFCVSYVPCICVLRVYNRLHLRLHLSRGTCKPRLWNVMSPLQAYLHVCTCSLFCYHDLRDNFFVDVPQSGVPVASWAGWASQSLWRVRHRGHKSAWSPGPCAFETRSIW